jgi:hypothetical protein
MIQPKTKVMHFHLQFVDHFNVDDDRTWSHPYFVSSDYFAGPGNPIFVILGGEGPITRILYPFVLKRLAYEFQGFVLQTEHRFYGASQPVRNDPSTLEMLNLFTPEQAISDYIRIIKSVQLELGCSLSRESPQYCPVITVGASYPGFLSAIMRLNFSDVVDIAYAASAPMILNAHHENENTNAYFDHVSNVAERARPGCTNGTRQTLEALYHDIKVTGVKKMADILGICYHRIPEYMKATADTFATELTQLVVSINADANMDYYPPSEEAFVTKLCQIFCNTSATYRQRYADFLLAVMKSDDYQDAKPISDSCFDFQTQLPDGRNATISSADWSGAGFSTTATRWEFQVCKDLVIKAGYAGPDSMFYPPREWTLDWLTEHCQNRFGTALMPQPGRLNRLWSFDTLERSSRIIFTNGENDGWIKGSYTQSSTDSILVLNFANGSHHSDLTHEWPRDDTRDIVEGHEKIVQTLRKWLGRIDS